MRVEFLNLKKGYQKLKTVIDKEIEDCLNSGVYISGNQVENFENSFKKYVDSKYFSSTGNGYDSLVLALKALDLQQGDEVIVPSHTFIATWLAPINLGLKIVPVDVNIDDFCLDFNKIESKINSRTKVIITVHIYGHPSDLNPILKIAKKHNLKVIEDAAQCVGAEYYTKKIGSHSDMVCWSFYPGKNLGAYGDAGGVSTDNKEYYERIKKLKNYGSSKKYVHDLIGINSRMDPIQASVLNCKLKYIDDYNSYRIEIAKLYNNELSNYYKLTNSSKNVKHVWHIYSIFSSKRNKLGEYLNSENVKVLSHYPISLNKQRCFSNLKFNNEDFKNAEFISNNQLSLPIDPFLDINKVEYVIDLCKRFSVKNNILF